MLQYQPSIICASAVYLALKTHGQTPWVRTACALSGAFASLPAPFPPTPNPTQERGIPSTPTTPRKEDPSPNPLWMNEVRLTNPF